MEGLIDEKGFRFLKKKVEKSSNVVNKVWVPAYNNQIPIGDF